MANELVESETIQQDIKDIVEILKRAGKPLPVLREEDTDVSFLPVTEEFLTGVIAGKKRLQARNLKIELKDREEERITIRWPDAVKILEEGIHRIGCLEKWWYKVTIYQREGKEVSRFEGSERLFYYIRKDSDGNRKVSSVFCAGGNWYDREKEFSDLGKKEKVRIIVSLLVVLFWGVPGVYLIFAFIKAITYANILKDILLGLFLMVSSGGFLLYLAFRNSAYLRRLPLHKRKRVHSRKVTARLLEKAPEFCLEKFLGILNSKLLRLLYADGPEEIGDIVSCDMTRFLQDYRDVVNCEFRNFWFTDMQEDKDYIYLDVAYHVTLYRDWRTGIYQQEQMLYLQLALPIHGIMESDLYNDWSIMKIET